MPSNNDIMQALFQRLTDAALGYPIAWPGVNFTPPSSGVWLQVEFQPNQGIDNGLSYADDIVPRGIMTAMVMARPGSGIIDIQTAADQVAAVYPKGTTISGMVRVVLQPWAFDISQDPDRLGVAVSVVYSG